MSEETTIGSAQKDSNPGIQSGTDSIIEQANAAAKRIEEANRKSEELIKQQQDLLAKQALSGKAFAGSSQPQMTEAERKKQEAMNFWKGTGLDETIRKYG